MGLGLAEDGVESLRSSGCCMEPGSPTSLEVVNGGVGLNPAVGMLCTVFRRPSTFRVVHDIRGIGS